MQVKFHRNEIASPMTVRLIQEFLEGASAKSTLQRYFPASEPDMSWIRRRAEIKENLGVMLTEI